MHAEHRLASYGIFVQNYPLNAALSPLTPVVTAGYLLAAPIRKALAQPPVSREVASR